MQKGFNLHVLHARLIPPELRNVICSFQIGNDCLLLSHAVSLTSMRESETGADQRTSRKIAQHRKNSLLFCLSKTSAPV